MNEDSSSFACLSFQENYGLVKYSKSPFPRQTEKKMKKKSTSIKRTLKPNERMQGKKMLKEGQE